MAFPSLLFIALSNGSSDNFDWRFSAASAFHEVVPLTPPWDLLIAFAIPSRVIFTIGIPFSLSPLMRSRTSISTFGGGFSACT